MKRLVTVEIIVLLVLLVAGDAFAFYQVRAAAEAERSHVEDQAAATACRDLLGTLQDAETGQRGYLLTGREEYLAPYRDALARLRALLARLEESPLAGRVDLSRLRRLIEDKLEELAETIRLRRQRGPSAATAVVLTDRGKRLMDDARVLVGRVRAVAEGKSEAQRRAVAEALSVLEYLRAAQILFAVVLAGVLLGLYARVPAGPVG